MVVLESQERITKNSFREDYISTVGIDFGIRNLEIKGSNIRLQIWDIAGSSVVHSHPDFKNFEYIIVVYDITQPNSFTAVTNLVQEIDKCNTEASKILVGNKCDREDKRMVSTEQGVAFAKQHKLDFHEVSPKTDYNVQKLFFDISSSFLMKVFNDSLKGIITAYITPLIFEQVKPNLTSPFGLYFDQLNKQLLVSDRNDSTIKRVCFKTTSVQHGSWNDGSLSEAFFNHPTSFCINRVGDLLIADCGNHIIQKISKGKVMTLCGSTQGKKDGLGKQAQFNNPFGICLDSEGFLICTDSKNHCICHISPKGEVNTITGSTSGFMDGPFETALFSDPQGVCLDKEGNIIIADCGNHSIRKLDMKNKRVSTLAGSNTTPGLSNGIASRALFNHPSFVCAGESDVFVSDCHNNVVRRISEGFVYTVGKVWKNPRGICFDLKGGLLVADDEGIRKVKVNQGLVDLVGGWRRKTEVFWMSLSVLYVPIEIRRILVRLFWKIERRNNKKWNC